MKILLVEDNNSLSQIARAAIPDINKRVMTYLEAQSEIKSGKFDFHLIDGFFPYGGIPQGEFERFYRKNPELGKLPSDTYLRYLAGDDSRDLPCGLFAAIELKEQGKDNFLIVTNPGRRHGRGPLEVILEISKRLGLPIFAGEGEYGDKSGFRYWERVAELIPQG